MNVKYFKTISYTGLTANNRMIAVVAMLFFVFFYQINAVCSRSISESLDEDSLLTPKKSSKRITVETKSFELSIKSLGEIDTTSKFEIWIFSSGDHFADSSFHLSKASNTTKVELKLSKNLTDSQLSKVRLKLTRHTGKDSLAAFKMRVMKNMTDGAKQHFIKETRTYFCIGDTSIILQSVPTKKNKLIAPQDSIGLEAALFNNINSVPDNDPPGFSQYYIRASIPLRKLHGIPNNSHRFHENIIWFRNLYITPTLNASSLNYVPVVFKDSNYYANKLDLLQYAYFKVPVHLNLATYIYRVNGIEYGHFYLYLLAEGIFTKDTIKSSGTSDIISSFIYGGGISYKTDEGVSKNIIFEVGTRIFTINPITSSLNANLNLQNRHLIDTALASNETKPLEINDKLFYSLEAFVNYKISSTASTYLHFDFTSNIVKDEEYFNNFFRIQLGFSVNVLDFFKNLKGSGSNKSK